MSLNSRTAYSLLKTVRPFSAVSHGQRERGFSATIPSVLHCFLKTRVNTRRTGSAAAMTFDFRLLFFQPASSYGRFSP